MPYLHTNDYVAVSDDECAIMTMKVTEMFMKKTVVPDLDSDPSESDDTIHPLYRFEDAQISESESNRENQVYIFMLYLSVFVLIYLLFTYRNFMYRIRLQECLSIGSHESYDDSSEEDCIIVPEDEYRFGGTHLSDIGLSQPNALLSSLVQNFGFESAYASAELIIKEVRRTIKPGQIFTRNNINKSKFIFMACLVKQSVDELTDKNVYENSKGLSPYSIFLVSAIDMAEFARNQPEGIIF